MRIARRLLGAREFVAGESVPALTQLPEPALPAFPHSAAKLSERGIVARPGAELQPLHGTDLKTGLLKVCATHGAI